MNDEDLGTMFDFIDITKKGTITYQQLLNAIENLQLDSKGIEDHVSKNDQIDKNLFVKVMYV